MNTIDLDQKDGFIELIRHIVTLRKNVKLPTGFRFCCLEDMLLNVGRTFAPAPIPKGVRRGRMKMCFHNAFHLSQLNDLIYCEGYASSVNVGLPMLHAWCCDKKGNIIDPTWGSDGANYLGVPIQETFAMRTILHNQRYCIIDDWEHDYPCLQLDPKTWVQELGV